MMLSRTTLAVIGLICCVAGQVNSSTTTREPSIQAYGLPKRFFTGNGYIHRVYADDESAGGSASVRLHPGRPSRIPGKFEPSDGIEDGTIEIIHLDASGSPILRNRRDVEDEPSSSPGEIMQTDESKVFRPLFVYRQQVARRQRIQRERSAAGRDLKPRYSYNNRNSIQY